MLIHCDAQNCVEASGLSKSYPRVSSYRASLQKRIVNQWKKWMNSQQDSETSEPVWALCDLSLEIKRGEVLGVIGSNGAGKSTLVRLLSRLTKPTQGRAVIQGKVASVLEVGSGFHPDLNVRENAVLNGVLLGMRRKEVEDKLEAILCFSDLKNQENIQLKKLSNGMQYRLAVSIALLSDADFVLLDEVLEVTDRAFEEKCFQFIRAQQKKGKTYLFVSHNLSQLRMVANRVLWMKAGKKYLLGEAGEVLAAYTAEVDGHE